MPKRGTVEVDGQVVAYELLEVDVRSAERRGTDAAGGRLAGDPALVIPGHGQTVASPRKLTEAAAALSTAGIAWCVDIFVPQGGDPIKARALSAIVRGTISELHPEVGRTEPPAQVTLIGWSHGAGEALRSAQHDPALFPRVTGLCPAGLVERRPTEFMLAFLSEVIHIVWTVVVRRDRASLQDAIRVGFDIVRGIWRDLIQSRSLQAVLDDMRWAGRKVPGPDFGYGGDVALIFARDDTVIRWRAVFPECAGPEEIPAHLEAYRRADFPGAARLQVAVLDGDHLSPESAATRCARAAFAMFGLPPVESDPNVGDYHTRL
jgi:hypothetical protein